jgi:hypothetical protein
MANQGKGKNGNGGDQADQVMDLIRDATALQVEMLGAAARVWSEIVERVASYNRELTNELMRFSGGETDANKSVKTLVESGQRHVADLTKLPAKIAETFQTRVEKRSGRKRARAGHPPA